MTTPTTDVALSNPNLPVGPSRPYVERIQAEWRKSLEGILEAGRILIEAENKLGKTRYLNMVQFELPFTRTTASRLRIIAGDKRITDCAYTHRLPPSWFTLYELTHLKDDAFYQAVEKGLIHPGMTQKETKRLVNNPNTAPSVRRQEGKRPPEGEADGQKSAQSAQSTESTRPSTSPVIKMSFTPGEWELIRAVLTAADRAGLVEQVAMELWPSEESCFRLTPPDSYVLAEKLELDETLTGLSVIGDWQTLEGEIVA